MKNPHKYLDTGNFLKALNNMTEETVYYLYREKIFITKNIPEGSTILDLGCGDGRAIFFLARKVGSNGKIIGIDNNKNMLKRAVEETKILKNVEIIYMDAKKTSFPDNYFDAVSITYNMFGNIEADERKVILKELFRIVKPNGLILGTVFSENAEKAQEEQYKRIGQTVDKIDSDFVYVSDLGFKSERFSKDKLKKILSQFNSKIEIEKISNIAYGFKIQVNN